MPIRQNLTHELVETGTSPHRQFTVVFYNADGSVDTYDGRDWKFYNTNIYQDTEEATEETTNG